MPTKSFPPFGSYGLISFRRETRLESVAGIEEEKQNPSLINRMRKGSKEG